ncbi:MAG: sigma-70 family RNA polymerase sigma factor [Firmicutes bacterium]|nr:sigma-70 family RNA polymerase sigma factor [Bacillota bacterium]
MSGGEAKRLPEERLRQLIAQAQAGDAAARELLVQANLPLVRAMAARFHSADAEDLLQVGAIGLIKAVDRFDLAYEVCFSTYAVPLILGEMRRYIRDDEPISVSRGLKERAVLVRQAQAELARRDGAEPTLKAVAAHLDLSEEQVVAAISAVQPVASLQAAVADDAPSLQDTLAAADEGDALVERLLVEELLAKLPPRQAYLLRRRYLEERTQAEVAAELSVSQAQVSRLEKRALATLRAELAAGE